MSMNGPGMWMPKQKEGKNWVVDYTIDMDGKTHTQNRKFRVQEDAYEFVKELKKLVADSRTTATAETHKVSKIPGR